MPLSLQINPKGIWSSNFTNENNESLYNNPSVSVLGGPFKNAPILLSGLVLSILSLKNFVILAVDSSFIDEKLWVH